MFVAPVPNLGHRSPKITLHNYEIQLSTGLSSLVNLSILTGPFISLNWEISTLTRA